MLCEDDYISFLVKLSREDRLIPYRLRQALSDSSLLMLGYDLTGCDFRTLLYCLIKERDYHYHPQSVCVLQLQPSREERAYLNRYMDEVTFKVFWGNTAEYLRQLAAELRRRR